MNIEINKNNQNKNAGSFHRASWRDIFIELGVERFIDLLKLSIFGDENEFLEM